MLCAYMCNFGHSIFKQLVMALFRFSLYDETWQISMSCIATQLVVCLKKFAVTSIFGGGELEAFGLLLLAGVWMGIQRAHSSMLFTIDMVLKPKLVQWTLQNDSIEFAEACSFSRHSNLSPFPFSFCFCFYIYFHQSTSSCIQLVVQNSISEVPAFNC